MMFFVIKCYNMLFMSLKWIDVDCYDCFAVLMTYLKYEHWITLVYPNFLRHSVVCGWPH